MYKIMDPRLEGVYDVKAAQKAGQICDQCLKDNPKSRPTMGTVVRHLAALQVGVSGLTMIVTNNQFLSFIVSSCGAVGGSGVTDPFCGLSSLCVRSLFFAAPQVGQAVPMCPNVIDCFPVSSLV